MEYKQFAKTKNPSQSGVVGGAPPTTTLEFSDSAITFLKKLPFVKVIGDDGIEISGSLIIVEKIPEQNRIIVGMGEHETGTEEGVNAYDSIYTFHSHPQDAYIRNNVKLGYPSNQDYVAFLECNLQYNTIFHAVIAVEGIYSICLSKECCKITNSNIKTYTNFVYDKYNIQYQKNDTVSKYINRVNDIRYRNKKIFIVQFADWKNVEKTSFLVGGNAPYDPLW